ncbi:hypothetical protein D3C81_667610 [compost metagenome]
MRGFRQWRNLDGIFQTLLDTPGREGLHRLGDFFAVVGRAVKVRPDTAQWLAKIAGAGLAQHLLEVVAFDFQQQACFAGVNQQPFRLEQALIIKAGRAGQCRKAGEDFQTMLVEHGFQAIQGHGGQLATGQLGQAVEVEQLVLREQHHQRADRVVE